MQVLEGGRLTIAAHRPTILIEGPKELWERMKAFFNEHDYVMLDGAAEHATALETPVWETVAVPREKLAQAGAKR